MEKSNIDFEDNANLVAEIEIAFSRLIGPLATMTVMKSFKDDYEELKNLLDIVVKWSADFQSKHTLSFISRENLLAVYDRIEKIKDKYLYNISLGDDNELSDEIGIWLWELMELRKKQIEGNEIK